MDKVHDPELFIGLVGAVGTDLPLVSSTLSSVLKDCGYQSEEIRMSDLIKSTPYYSGLSDFDNKPEGNRINAYMDAGDNIRKESGTPGILSIMAMLRIKRYREKHEDNELQGEASEPQPIPRQAYIINSIKHPAEIDILKDTYGKAFITLSIYSPRSDRLDCLTSKLVSSSYRAKDQSTFRSEAEKLIEKDAKSGVEDYGQNVSEAFPKGDIFIKMEKQEKLKDSISRAIEVWFGHPFRTPTVDEYGMFHAKATSLKSADLSRQVGAVITSKKGEVLSTGCNEVPKSGGGLYWEGDDGDDRDFQIGYDSTAKMKEQMVGEIIDRLQRHKLLNEEETKKELSDIVDDLLYGNKKRVLKGTRVSSIIEFGRIVHAEMAAITEAARRGISIEKSTLYCTTYPCHMCARHIISSGVKRVVFVEPYPKSMTRELYKNSITNDEYCNDESLIKFEPFVGVSPNRYVEFFSMDNKRRKDAYGNAVDWRISENSPKVESTTFYLEAERSHARWFATNGKTAYLVNDEGERWTLPVR